MKTISKTMEYPAAPNPSGATQIPSLSSRIFLTIHQGFSNSQSKEKYNNNMEYWIKRVSSHKKLKICKQK
jgi:hypothetical protein